MSDMEVRDWIDDKNKYTGIVTFLQGDTSVPLFYSIDGNKVNEKEWKDFQFKNKLEAFLDE